jgi:hypothetical protein
MSVVGGDIQEITYNHPDVGSGVLYPKSQEEATVDYGGLRTADDDAAIDGGGRAVQQLQRTRWSVSVPITHDMLSKDELQALTAMAESGKDAEWTFQHTNGDLRRGKGKPVGDLQSNFGSAQIDLKISGGGRLERI